jgi:hypothetical protein
MDFSYTEEQNLIREATISFSQRELNEGAADRDRDQAFSKENWLKCGEMGLQGMPVDAEYGGSGVDPLTTAVALEAFGYGCQDGGLVFAVCAHLLACVVPIWRFGSEDQKQRYLPRLCSGELIAVNGMTEPGSGSDAFSMSSRAEPDGDGYRLNGRKMFASNGPVADLAVFYAVTDPQKGYHGGVTAFLVEKGTPGFGTGQKFEKIGLRSCPIGELVLEDVFVPADAVLGGVGSGSSIFTHSMEWERICIAAAHVGKMESLLQQALEYARTRSAFGQKIGKFQSVSNRIADMKVRLEAARLLTYKAATRLEKARDVAMDASMVKVFASESLVTSAMDTVRTFGGYGIMVEYDVERVLRDSIASTLYSGTNDMQRNIIARWLGL